MAEPSDGASNDRDAQPAEADDGFVYRDPDTAPAALVQLAKQGGKGWVYEVDVTDVVRDRPIAMKSVVGAWEVDEAGELTGWFASNGTTFPVAAKLDYTTNLWPHSLGRVGIDYHAPPSRLWHERWPFSLVSDEKPESRIIAVVGLALAAAVLSLFAAAILLR